MPEPFSPNEPFDQVFLLKGIDERRTRTGKPFLTLTLGNSEGTWDGRVWDMAMTSLPGLMEGDPVRAAGTAQLYQENLQLIVERVERVEGAVDPRELYPSTGESEEELRRRFKALVSGIDDPWLKKLMAVMADDRDILGRYFISPAAISMHHARIGGLAEHSLNVCQLALGVVKSAPWLDRDLLTVGSLLHDVGKILEYETAGDFRYTIGGKFLGHIIQGHDIVEGWISLIPGFPERLALEVLHVLLSHHGTLEFGSPKVPVTAEALVIHFADDLDAKLDMVRDAGQEPGTEEAFVRGLRRSFQYRNPLTGPEGAERAAREGPLAKASADKDDGDAESWRRDGTQPQTQGDTDSRIQSKKPKKGGNQEELF